ncbi:MAG: hypothetical protein GX230_08270 [Lentisphaerae bacterium]|jgi:transcription antitermination factor NusG|nr:hypothetical protein [Lentisphaerota bacterium]
MDGECMEEVTRLSPLANWQVLFLKPRSEKKVAEVCSIYGIPHYLPLRTVPRVSQRRRFNVTLPLFPGYIFAAVTPENRMPILRTNHLIRTLTPRHSVSLLRDLVQVRRALAITPDLQPVVELVTGQKIRIKSGPFMGAEGVVERLASSMRVVLTVNMIGQGVSVTAKRSQVELA